MIATDPGSVKDVEAWIRRTGHTWWRDVRTAKNGIYRGESRVNGLVRESLFRETLFHYCRSW
jgi:hypothetical protein